MIEKLYTVEEVAELASVTGRTIRNYLKSGRLVGRKIGGQWRFPETEVQRLLTGGEPEDYPEASAPAEAPAAIIPPEDIPSQPPVQQPVTQTASQPVVPQPAAQSQPSQNTTASAPPIYVAPPPAAAPSQETEEIWQEEEWVEEIVYTPPAAERTHTEIPPQKAHPSSGMYTHTAVYHNKPAALPGNPSGQQYEAPRPAPVRPAQNAASGHTYAAVPPAAQPYSGLEHQRQPSSPYSETAPVEPVYTGPTSFGIPVNSMVNRATSSQNRPVHHTPAEVMPQHNSPIVQQPAQPTPAPVQPVAQAMNTASFPGFVVPYGYQLVPIGTIPPPFFTQQQAPEPAPAQPMQQKTEDPPAYQQPAPTQTPAPEPRRPSREPQPAPAQADDVTLSNLSDVAKKVMRFASQVHDCTEGPQICSIVDLQQSLESAKITSERLSSIARQESEHGTACQCFVEYDERYFVARYTLFGSSSFLARCLKLIG